MSARNYVQAIGAGATIRLPGGRYFFVKQATSAITITTQGNTGTPARFENIGAGSKFGPVPDKWTFLDVFSAGAQTVELVISDDGDFEVANAVTVSGVAQVADLPSAAIAVTASAALATATSLDIAANTSRRRITICNASTSAGAVWIRDQSATTSAGIELQPGQSVTMETTAALRVRNNSGSSADISTLEET